MLSPSIAETFEAGGWPMYPILVLGVFLLIAAGRYAKRPGDRRLQIVTDLRAVTLLIGVMGTTLGMIHCLMNLHSLPPGRAYVDVALLGLGESLNCFAFSIVMISYSALITMVGRLRASADE